MGVRKLDITYEIVQRCSAAIVILSDATENCRKTSKSGDCAKILSENDHEYAFRISD